MMNNMMVYYTYVIIITVLAMAVLSVLVFENDRISRYKKNLFVMANIFISIASIVECAGVHITGNVAFPRFLLIALKTVDYIFTPMTAGALIILMENSLRRRRLFWGIFLGNAVLQLISAFNGWMIVVDDANQYTHSVLYPLYIVLYSSMVIVLAVKMLLYGKKFRKQNRKSLYAIMILLFMGAAMQEIIGRNCRVAYLAAAFGSAFLFIHYSEFSQIRQDDEISEQLIKISNDALTGALSRFAYIEAIRAMDRKKPDDLVAFLIDINGLKAVNDSGGHEAGDELICAVAKCIDSILGKYGKTYRIGGDEFVVFCNMTKEQVKSSLVALKHKAEHWKNKKFGCISMSVGYAIADEYGELTVEELVKEADRRMYEQKKKYYMESGRDRRHRINRQNA